MVHKIKVSTTELVPGMYVCELDRPWLETPFSFQGFPLRCEEDIREVHRYCSYVYVDPERSSAGAFTPRLRKPVPQPPVHTEKMRAVRPARPARPEKGPKFWLKRTFGGGRRAPLPVELVHSLDVGKRAFDSTSRMVRTITMDVRWGRGVDLPAAKEAVSLCAEQVARNPDALLLYASIRDKDEATARHSLSVSVLSLVLGQHLGLPRAKLRELGVAALLHDVGKIRLPVELLSKTARLSAQEERILRRHTDLGRDILRACEDIPVSAVEVAHAHHERLDGSGYPRGLREEDIGTFTRIVAIADSYDDIVNEHPDERSRTSIEAMKLLQAAGGNRFDPSMVSSLIDAIGIFPPGSLVRLNNGESGVVVRTNPGYDFRPAVLVLRDAADSPVEPRYLDLAQARGKRGAQLQISRMLHESECGIDRRIFRSGELLTYLRG